MNKPFIKFIFNGKRTTLRSFEKSNRSVRHSLTQQLLNHVPQINGVDVRSVPQDAAVQLVKRAGRKITLLVEQNAEELFKQSEFYNLVCMLFRHFSLLGDFNCKPGLDDVSMCAVCLSLRLCCVFFQIKLELVLKLLKVKVTTLASTLIFIRSIENIQQVTLYESNLS